MNRKKSNGQIEKNNGDLTSSKSLKKRKTIIVADDDDDMRYIFKTILEEAGYDVVLKKDGNELMKNDFPLPDLFLIDKLLSGMNGLDICRHLKTEDRTKSISVVMTSAAPGIDIQSKNAGADDHLEKPFELSHLLKIIEKNI